MMHVVLISDTHGKHEALEIPPCDLLIHAGDLSQRGTPDEVTAALRWLAAQPAEHTVLVAGNHDIAMERAPAPFRSHCEAHGLVWLEDEAREVAGLTIWGSPWTLRFGSWAFQKDADELAAFWDRIPDDADIVVTHSPAFGIRDRIHIGKQVGCPGLRKRLREVTPKLHVSGHIHEAGGAEQHEGVLHVNAASVTLTRQIRPAISLELAL